MSEDQITLAIQSSEGRKRLKISLNTSGSTLKTQIKTLLNIDGDFEAKRDKNGRPGEQIQFSQTSTIASLELKTGDILFITPKSGTSSKISSAEDNDDVEVESAGEEINLTAAECQKRIDSFIEVTKTDEAFAQSVLQDHDWNLETALNAFLVSSVPSDGPKEEDGESKIVSTKPPSLLGLITWNIDGLNDKNLPKRLRAITNQINQLKPDVVYIQEANEQAVEAFEKDLFEYSVLEQGTGGQYYTCILLRQTTIYLDEVKNKLFENTTMGRGLQIVKAHMGDVKLAFLNVHLESTKDFSKQRVQQLKECFEEIQKIGKDYTVILAGDLNIRDSEIDQLKGLPSDMYDLWIKLGKRKEVQYTWDCLRNTNVEFPGKFKPRMRFDRILVQESLKKNVTAKSFNLIGIEKVPGTQTFPSDHWGILAVFNLSSM